MDTYSYRILHCFPTSPSLPPSYFLYIQLLPKLYRYRYDPSPKVRASMGGLWKVLLGSSKTPILKHFNAIASDLIQHLGNRQVRSRQAVRLPLLFTHLIILSLNFSPNIIHIIALFFSFPPFSSSSSSLALPYVTFSLLLVFTLVRSLPCLSLFGLCSSVSLMMLMKMSGSQLLPLPRHFTISLSDSVTHS